MRLLSRDENSQITRARVMKNRKNHFWGVIVSLFALTGSVVFGATYGGGAGTVTNPYIIATKAHLLELAATTTDYDKCFVLTANIDLAGEMFTTAVIAPDTDDSDYWFTGTAFTGVFDGNNHIISGLTIHNDEAGYLGLFGATTAGQVTNLRLTNVNIGGYNATDVGGLMGENDGSMISNCSCTGQISGRDCVGGLAGSSDSGAITACHTAGTVTGTGVCVYDVGGLVGWNGGDISNCYSTCAVTTIYHASDLGGLVGGNWGTISDCYSAGTVTCQESSNSVGGLAGGNSGTFNNCFWDTTISGQPTSAGGTGMATTDMQTLATFTDATWDFLNETVNGTSDYWRMCVDGVHYPKLTWQHVEVGDFACPDGVAMDDFNRLSRDWMASYSAALYGADADGDGTVDTNDLAVLVQHWLE
jgi:hypothetical protein